MFGARWQLAGGVSPLRRNPREAKPPGTDDRFDERTDRLISEMAQALGLRTGASEPSPPHSKHAWSTA